MLDIQEISVGLPQHENRWARTDFIVICETQSLGSVGFLDRARI